MSLINTTLSISSSGKVTTTPDSVTVTQNDTTLEYTLDRASEAEWQLTGASTTASSGQTSRPVVSPDGNSVNIVDANTVAETFSVIIYFAERTSGAKHWHDPTVTNEPPA